MSKPALWISAVGTAAGYGLTAAARRLWGSSVHVIGTDTNPAHLVAASAELDEFRQVMPVADPSYSSFMVEELSTSRPLLHVGLVDLELVLAARWHQAGLPSAVRTNAPDSHAAEVCFDKAKCHEWLVESGLSSPVTVPIAHAEWRGVPAIAKPRMGFGSKGVVRVASFEELNQLRHEGDLVLQEECAPPEITIDVYRSFAGRFAAARCRERLEVKAGVCTKARLYRDPELEQLGCVVANKLGLRGAVCIQVMRSRENGKWCVTDVNPRPGAGSPMCGAAGFDVLAAMVAEGLGLADPEHYLGGWGDGEQFVLRHFEEVVVGP